MKPDVRTAQVESSVEILMHSIIDMVLSDRRSLGRPIDTSNDRLLVVPGVAYHGEIEVSITANPLHAIFNLS